MNIEQITLARKVLDHITAHPEQHNQMTFYSPRRCGTQACVAGWAVLLSGLSPFNYRDLDVYAANLLGLTSDQAGALFYGTWSESEARDQLASYIAEAEAAL